MATHSTVWTGILSSATSTLSIGYAVVENGSGNFVAATSANRTSYGRSAGVAITAASSTNKAFEYQVAGLLVASISGLAAGSASWVRVSSTGTLERFTPSAGGTSDIIGYAEANGNVHLCPGIVDEDMASGGGGGGGTVPTGTGFTHITGGSQDAAAKKVDVTASADVTVPAAGVVSSDGSVLGSITRTSTDGTSLTVQGLYFEIADETDTTKRARFDASGITPGQTQVWSFPDADDTLVGNITPATLTNKTISLASNTLGGTLQGALLRVNGSSVFTELALGTAKQHLRVNAGATDIEWASYGTNVDTFLTTPSSANLAAAITDETGTGALVFATSPTLTTPTVATSITASGASLGIRADTLAIDDSLGATRLTVNASGTAVQAGTLSLIDGGATYFYTVTPATLAASRVVNLPALTGNDTFVFESHTQTLTNKTVSGPSFAASSYLSVGASPSTTGFLRCDGASTVDLVSFKSGATDYSAINWSTSGALSFGSSTWSNFIRGSDITFASTAVYLGKWTSAGLQIGSNSTDFGGGSGVIGIDNAATVPTTNPTNGVVLYVDPADGHLKYLAADGTVIDIWTGL